MSNSGWHRSVVVGLCTIVAGTYTQAGYAGPDTGEEIPQAQEAAVDIMSVTATREARASKDVPASIAVVDGERIESARMFNVSDALNDTPGVLINSQNGGYDARLIIRGAGLKAPYGIREIMLLRDGVPLTDPDSFTRLDFIDTQDIERIEVTKGPGNIYALGSAGGTVQIISKSVFDSTGTTIKAGGGDQGAANLHVRSGTTLGADDSQALAVTFSHRRMNNEWRDHNEFETYQLSVKHGVFLSGDTTLESELSYTDSNLELPGSLSAAQFEDYLDGGKVTDNNSAFKDSARNSEILFFNTRLEKPLTETLMYKPRFYVNRWSHFHPVTGVINESGAVTVIGTDQEFTFAHELWGASELVAGVTLKQDQTPDSRKYKYADVSTTPGGRLLATLSDEKGDLIATSQDINRVAGIFAQETLHPAERWLVDTGFRYDTIHLYSDGNEQEAYNYATGTYVAGEGDWMLDKTFRLFSANLGASYQLTGTTSLFVNLAQGQQVPTASEVESNRDLKASIARNTELGIKGRSGSWRYDGSLYLIRVEDEVVSTLVDGRSEYLNAGQTDKKGVEFSGSAQVMASESAGEGWLGASYAYSDYTFDTLIEKGTDYSGNQLPYIPQQQYSLFLQWQLSGWKARLQADSWGEYYVDNANSEKYQGYELISSLNLGYEQGQHALAVNIQNLADKRYALEVTKDSRGNLSYTPAAPRTFLLSYQYQFN